MRLFLAIPFRLENIAQREDILEIIRKKKKELKKFPNIRWEKDQKLHMTLLFLGKVKDNDLKKIKKAVKNAIKKSKFFKINFTKIDWYPLEKNARMIWLKGNFSSQANFLKKEILKELLKENIEFKIDKRPVLSHITLARIKPPLIPAPKICQKINFDLNVKGIELWQSFLLRSGSEYQKLEKFDFNHNSSAN